MKRLSLSLIGALTLYAISPAGVADPRLDDVRHQVVRFDDLDLTQAVGAQELYYRIQTAARDVCENYYRLGRDRSCIEQAIARAVSQVGLPQLTARHLAASNRQPLQRPPQARLDD
jgi:UrcA family protein